MKLKVKTLVAACSLFAVLGAMSLPANAQDDLKSVLDRLNVTAPNFHSTQASVEFDTIVTDPVPDTDVQKGEVYYDRKSGPVRMGVHLNQHNGNAAVKTYTYSNGELKLYESGVDQVTTFTKAAKFEGYLVLGFGASGNDLAAKWDIKYLGSENVSDGKGMVKTAKLEMVAKDPDVRKNLVRVTIWIDPDHAVSLKQIFVLSATSTYVCQYTNFKFNQSLPGDAFTLKTDKQTVYRNQ